MTHEEFQEGKFLISIYPTRLFLAAICKGSDFKLPLVHVCHGVKKKAMS